MRLLKTAVFSTGLALAGISGTFAQGDSGDQQLSSFQLMTGRVIVLTPDGRVAMRPLDGSGMADEMMKDAHPMTSGGIFFMHENKLYAAPDRPVQGGAMLSDTIARSTAAR